MVGAGMSFQAAVVGVLILWWFIPSNAVIDVGLLFTAGYDRVVETIRDFQLWIYPPPPVVLPKEESALDAVAVKEQSDGFASVLAQIRAINNDSVSQHTTQRELSCSSLEINIG